MAAGTSENGSTANDMARDGSSQLMEPNVKAFGNRTNESDGLTMPETVSSSPPLARSHDILFIYLSNKIKLRCD